MDRHNLTVNESKVLRILIDDSRKSNEEIAKLTGLSRNTVSSIIRSLLSKHIIKNFTVNIVEPFNRTIVIATVPDISKIPKNFIIESFDISNGQFLCIMTANVLEHDFPYSTIYISHRKTVEDDNLKSFDLYCDYCDNLIKGEPFQVEWKNSKYFTCCPNCQADLLKQLKRA
ncbi:MAG: TRASH domain-containing protein [Thermoplasmataceae archaeon]